MKKLTFILCVTFTVLSGCTSIGINTVDDRYEEYILNCINEYSLHSRSNIIDKANRVYVFYADSNLVDVFFSHGDVGDFTARSPDYEGLLYCGGIVNREFEIYKLKYAKSAKDLFRKPGFEVGAVNAHTCGLAKERWYILNGVKLEYKGEKIFDCWK